MKLLTKRLILRPPTMQDAKAIFRNINNLNVSRYLLSVPYPYNLKDAKWFINHCAEKAREKPKSNYELNIELKSQKGIIGGIGITNINFENLDKSPSDDRKDNSPEILNKDGNLHK